MSPGRGSWYSEEEQEEEEEESEEGGCCRDIDIRGASADNEDSIGSNTDIGLKSS